MARKPRILFVSAGSSARGEMAVGFAWYLAGKKIAAVSAGTDTQTINPYSQWAMNEAGIDISVRLSEPLEKKDLASFDHVVTIGSEARRTCLEVPNGVTLEHWEVPDPAKVRGRPSDMILAFRVVRNEIEGRVHKLLSELLLK